MLDSVALIIGYAVIYVAALALVYGFLLLVGIFIYDFSMYREMKKIYPKTRYFENFL